jgi:hypothetical protein
MKKGPSRALFYILNRMAKMATAKATSAAVMLTA